MTYTANVPVTGQSLGNSRPTINSNFSVIQSVFDNNHVDFNATNAGAHTHVDLVTQGANPDPAATIVSHYARNLSGVTEWFFQKESTPGPIPGQAIQMSNGKIINAGGFPNATGQTFLPGGFQLKWGYTGIASLGTVPVTFASLALDDFTVAGLTGWAISSSVAGSFAVTLVNKTSITIKAGVLSSATNVLWFAIGY